MEGGVEKHCEHIYPLLAEHHHLTVFRRRSYVRNNRTYPNISFKDLPSTRIKGAEALLHSVLSAIHTIIQKPDVAHIHNIGPALVSPLLKLFSIPIVLTYHSPNYEHKKWGPVARSILRLSERVALKCADRIIFVNRFQMEKYSEQVQKKSEYIPNGIQIPGISQEQDCLEQFGLRDRRYILSVGRITPEKGFHTLIQAFRDCGAEDCALVIAGGVEFESGYKKELLKLAEGLPVVFTDYVQGETLRQLYSHAALYVLASENEGFPLVLLEAMGYARNVLVSDIPATKLVDLKPGDYFAAGDHRALAEQMAKKLGENPHRQYDLSAFTWKECANHVSRIYGEIGR